MDDVQECFWACEGTAAVPCSAVITAHKFHSGSDCRNMRGDSSASLHCEHKTHLKSHRGQFCHRLDHHAEKCRARHKRAESISHHASFSVRPSSGENSRPSLERCSSFAFCVLVQKENSPFIVKRGGICTLAAEQEIAHVVAEGAADVAAAVGQGTRQAAAVERPEGVGAAETWRDVVLLKLSKTFHWTAAAPNTMTIKSRYLYKCRRFGPSSVLRKYLRQRKRRKMPSQQVEADV